MGHGLLAIYSLIECNLFDTSKNPKEGSLFSLAMPLMLGGAALEGILAARDFSLSSLLG